MNRREQRLSLWLGAVAGALVPVADAWTAPMALPAVVDAGGQRMASASYTMDGSLGGIAGVSTGAAPATVLKSGYVGQLYEVVTLTVTGMPASVNEGGTSQLRAVARLDDDTALALAPDEVGWGPAAWPVASIGVDGVLLAAPVYADATATVTGRLGEVVGTVAIRVTDGNPDNYGLYAGDTIPDGWQVRYFGTNNPLGMAGEDASHTGQNNLYKYTADLDPTNPASIFQIVAASNAVDWRVYFPSSTARTYTLYYTTNLLAATWTNVTMQSGIAGWGGVMALTDTNATLRFYRVGVHVP
jgi:hypothetical protein